MILRVRRHIDMVVIWYRKVKAAAEQCDRSGS